jgi:hypothetical protein
VAVEEEQHTGRPAVVSLRSVSVLAAVVLVPALAYAVTVLWPYFSGDGGSWLGLPGMFALLLAPAGALVSFVGVAVQLAAAFPRRGRRIAPGVAVGLGIVAVLDLAVLFFFLSPLGQSSIMWQVD